MHPVSADIPRRRLLFWAALCPLLIAAALAAGLGLPLWNAALSDRQALSAAAARSAARGVDDWLRRHSDAARRAAGYPEIRRVMNLSRHHDSLRGLLNAALDGLLEHDHPQGIVMLRGSHDPDDLLSRGADIPPHLRPSLDGMETTAPANPPHRTAVTISGPVVLEGTECLLFSAPVLALGTDAPARGHRAANGSAPVEDGRRLGAAVLAYPTAGLRALLPEKPDAVLALNTATGRFLLRSGPSGPLSPAEQAALDAARGGRKGVETRGDSLYAYAPLADRNGGLLLLAPAAPLLPRFRLLLWAAGICVLSLGGAWLLSRPLAGRMLLPARELRAETDRNAAALADLQLARRRAEEADVRRIRLAGELIRILETTRRTLARELHDQAGQMLTTLLLRLETLRRDLENGALSPAQGAAALETASEDLRRIQVEVRGLAKGLRPPALDALGLIPAVEALGDEYRQGGMAVHVFHDALPELSDDAALTLYRIIQEALTNAVRHGRASSVHIGLMGREGGVSLSVEDDGRGFDADAGTEGLGLTLMRERAARLGGTLRVESRPGQGVTVMVFLPGEKGERKVFS